MKHNQHNPNFKFIRDPVEFNKNTEKDVLQYCLGATLYMPGTKDVADKIVSKNIEGLASMVMCFEDAIQEKDLSSAETNVIRHLDTLSESLHKGIITNNDIPLIFLRARTPEQFEKFTQRIKRDHMKVLSGFVFPKFCSNNGHEYLNHLRMLNGKFHASLYGMPILEGRKIAQKETRLYELDRVKQIIEEYRDTILNIRVGATDFSSIFGLRRGINYSVYDILTVRDCLSDILNYFSRYGKEYVISAPVWEYFLAHKKQNLSHLSKENICHSLLKRNTIIGEAVDGLLREVILDKANGFVGKTIIHPSHLKYVNSMQAITKEEYEDAVQILQSAGGVHRSVNANKMNESNPHRNWARRIVALAKVYGVVENESSYLELFEN